MQDGLVDRYFNRRISRHLTRWFLKTALTPNQITLLSFLVGLVSAFFFWRGGYLGGVLGAVFFQFSAILDCCDGEVARLRSMQSAFGRWLDLVCDNIVHVLIFLAIAAALYRDTASPLILIAGGAAAIGAWLSLKLVLLVERLRAGTPGMAASGSRVRGPVGGMTERLTNRDFSVILLLFSLIGRLDWFLWLAAAGSNAFWLLLWVGYVRRRH